MWGFFLEAPKFCLKCTKIRKTFRISSISETYLRVLYEVNYGGKTSDTKMLLFTKYNTFIFLNMRSL